MVDSSGERQLALRRVRWMAGAARITARAALGVWHRTVVEGAENLPRSGPALLLPKHRAFRDILLEGVVLHRVTGRYGTYVMKTGLWGILERLGGIKVVRPKDIRRLRDRQERRAEIERARRENTRLQRYLTWLYAQGELVVSHPEGQRYQETMGPLQKEIVEHLVQAERELGIRVPLIPIGLEYESFARPRARVFLRVGEPLRSEDFADSRQLLEAAGSRIRDLSGLAQTGGPRGSESAGTPSTGG